jgi:hypothetical protein
VIRLADEQAWARAKGELLGFARALDRDNAGITAHQMRMAVARADSFGPLLDLCRTFLDELASAADADTPTMARARRLIARIDEVTA